MSGQVNHTADAHVAFRSTRKIVITGVLIALTVLLSLTPLGFIPVPTAAGSATILHIPAVIGGILEGPIVGLVIGLSFGITSFLHATLPFFKNPVVAIVPRMLIGVIAYLAYTGMNRLLRNRASVISVVVAAVLGSATNTIGVLWLIHVYFHWTLATILTVALGNGIPEAIVCAILTTAVVFGYRATAFPRRRKSRISE